MRCRSALGVLALCSLLLAACGGSDHAPQPPDQTGRAVLTIDWPVPPERLVPYAANSIRVQLHEEQTLVREVVVDRPPGGGLTSTTIGELPVTTLALTATAYPETGAGGRAQAGGATTVTVVAGQDTAVSLTLTSTIATFTLAPAQTGLLVGETKSLVAEAKNAAGEVVLLPERATWQIESGAGFIALASSRGAAEYTRQVTGTTGGGTASVRVSVDEGAGKTLTASSTLTVADVVVRISPAAMLLATGGQHKFVADVSGALDTGVTWSVEEGAAGGTIAADGTYTAPGTAATYHVVATSVQEAGKAGNAAVIVRQPAGGLALSAWPKSGADAQNTGRGIGSGCRGVLKWTFATGGGIWSSPAIGADGTVYVGSDDGKVYALDGETGVKKWEFTTGGYVRSSPAVGADGTVYIGSRDDKVYALDGATGAMKWEFATGNDVEASPAIDADGTVYVGSDDRSVHALDGATGAEKWAHDTGGGIQSCAAISLDGGVIYVLAQAQQLRALDAATGTRLWEYYPYWSTGSSYSAPVIGPDGTVFFNACYGVAVALDGATGQVKWQISGDHGQDTPGAASLGEDGTVYAPVARQSLWALDGATGGKKWGFTTGGEIYSAPAIAADGTVCIGSDDKKLYALDGATGALKWTYSTGGVVRSSPAIGADGTVYFGSWDKKVYALGAGGDLDVIISRAFGEWLR